MNQGESSHFSKTQFSRTFCERDGKNMSRQLSAISTIDTKNVRIYFRRQASQASLHSASSVKLAEMSSRPISIDSEDNLDQEPPTIIRTATDSTPPPRNPAVTQSLLSASRSCSVPNLVRRASFMDKIVCQIFNYLYMGNIESAYNANVLCRLNIGYIIDVSNVDTHKVPRNKRSDCPCLCPSETAHSRVRMTISVEESSQSDLIPYFRDVNELISSANACGKSVLIHSFHGVNRCAVFVIQYLMMVKRVNLHTAERLLYAVAPSAQITENFVRSLKRWEHILKTEKPTVAELPKLNANTKSAWM